jgi:hypothetical protein
MDRTKNRTLGIAGVVLALGLVATACGGGAQAASGPLSVKILSPKSGATVSEPFTVKVWSNVPLGDPSTGDHHVHLCFDGGSCDTEYTLVYGNSIQVSNLSGGMHTIEASLRNADHSDAGPHTSITVTVSGSGAGSSTTGTGSSGGSGSGSSGYGYGNG